MKNKWKIPVPALVFAALWLGGCAPAASPYAGWEAREIKALSAEEVAGYLSGEGMSMALAAELNGYPGPLHVLEFADELELSDFQRESVERMFSEMRDESRALGRDIVAREAELNALFAEKRADEARLRETTREIARLKGELRIAHLKQHLKTLPLLTAEQAARYDELRGYHSGHNHAH